MSRFKYFYGDDIDLPEWVGEVDEQYQVLLDMENKKEICCLTEPEDRTFGRDLDDVVSLLNEMDKEIKKDSI